MSVTEEYYLLKIFTQRNLLILKFITLFSNFRYGVNWWNYWIGHWCLSLRMNNKYYLAYIYKNWNERFKYQKCIPYNSQAEFIHNIYQKLRIQLNFYLFERKCPKTSMHSSWLLKRGTDFRIRNIGQLIRFPLLIRSRTLKWFFYEAHFWLQ